MAPAVRIVCVQLGRRGGGPHFAVELARELALCAQCASMAIFHQDNPFLMPTDRDRPDWRLVSSASPSFGSVRRLRALFREVSRSFAPTHWLIAMQHPLDLALRDIMHDGNASVDVVVHDGNTHWGDKYWWLRPINLLEEFGASRLLALSTHVFRIVRSRWPSGVVMQLWHPPFTEPKRPAVPKNRTGRLRILFFGRIQTYKGLELLMQSVAIMQKRGMPFELTIVGEGDIKPSVRTDIRKAGVRLVNRFVREEEVASYFEWCDVVVLPYIEASQSGVVATALSFRRPVIGTPVGGLREQISTQCAGMVIEESSPSCLANALHAITYEANAFSLNGGRRVDLESSHGWAVWVLRYVQSCMPTCGGLKGI